MSRGQMAAAFSTLGEGLNEMNARWREKKTGWMLLLLAVCIVAGFSAWWMADRSEEDPIPPPPIEKSPATAEAWLTTGDQQHLLEPQQPIQWTKQQPKRTLPKQITPSSLIHPKRIKRWMDSVLP